MINQKAFAAVLLLSSALGACAQDEAPMADDAAIQAAINSSERTAEMRERDAGRRPAEVLHLAGLRPGQHVVELGSFGQWYSTILAAVLGPDGQLDMVDPTAFAQFAEEPGNAFAAAHANTDFHLVDYNEASLPAAADIVFNILFYHDLQGAGVDMSVLNAKVFEALKPGGVYLIIDHRAEDGSGRRDSGTLHRIDAETIVEEVTAAGFELAERSDLLAHPDDSRTENVFSMRGDTDRALLVFKKPD